MPTGEAVVKYDDRKVTAAYLRAAINSIGYRATARPPKKGRAAKPKAPAYCGVESCDTQPPG